MSFSQDIKIEILHQEFSKEQAESLISGLVASSGIKRGLNLIVKINRIDISEQIRDILNQMNISHFESLQNRNWIVMEKDMTIEAIKLPAQYFAGVFLGGGSISDKTSTSYHLELQFYSHINAIKVQLFLNNYNFNFTLIQRRKMWVLYIKKSELIADFLRAIQVFGALMVFEDERINRDFKNQLNRYSNLDTYNQKKLVKASQIFLNQYKFIIDHQLLDKFRDIELEFFEIKKRNTYLSLAELTDKFYKQTGIKKTRAGLSHYLIKLRKIVNQNAL